MATDIMEQYRQANRRRQDRLDPAGATLRQYQDLADRQARQPRQIAQPTAFSQPAASARATSGNSVQAQQYRATAATAGEEAAKVQQSITGSLRPRNANVAPTDPSTGIRVSSGNTGNSGNASRTLGSGTGTGIAISWRWNRTSGRWTVWDGAGCLRGATAAGWTLRIRQRPPPCA